MSFVIPSHQKINLTNQEKYRQSKTFKCKNFKKSIIQKMGYQIYELLSHSRNKNTTDKRSLHEKIVQKTSPQLFERI